MVGVLIIFGHRPTVLSFRLFRMPMAKVPQELSIAGKFLNAVVAGVSSQPHIALPVDNDGMFGSGSWSRNSLGRPPRHVVRAAPGLQQVAVGVKFEDRRRRDAAIGTRR